MKLSEAIRLGAKMRPQCQGALFDLLWDPNRPDDHKIGSCALGAGFEAAEIMDPEQYLHDLTVITYSIADLRKFEGLESLFYGRKFENPVSRELAEINDVITDLNDDHAWSREQIADWLEGLGL